MNKKINVNSKANVYFGPSIFGVIKECTVFVSNLKLDKLLKKINVLSEFVCSIEEYPTKKNELSDKNSALYIFYKEAQREIEKIGGNKNDI